MKGTVRLPAVSGLFYEADPARLRREAEGMLAAARGPRRPMNRWRALLLPHAGYVFSGRIAAAGVAAVEWPRRVVLLGPNHRGIGAPAALSTAAAWHTPLGDIPTDVALVEALLSSCPTLDEDEKAHAAEHAIEVILPFLQLVRPDLSVACLSLGEPDLSLCVSVGRAVASVVSASEEAGEGRVALVVSSDLNHYLSKTENRQKDDRAIDALLSGDPRELFTRVLTREHISMCGILPATALLEALGALAEKGPACRPVLVARGDSSDAGGDEDRVVGYASILWEEGAPAA